MNIREFCKNVVTYDIKVRIDYSHTEDGIIVRTKSYAKKPKQTLISNQLLFDDKVSDEQFKEHLIESLNNLTK
jgi:hypothetical protein